MTKTFCDFCETYIPGPTPQFCLCDTCVQDIATIIDKYKNDRKRERS